MSRDFIPADISLSLDEIRFCLQEQFSLQIKDIHLLGEGWDNSVYLVNSHLVFRFPRRKVKAFLLEREIRLLSQIKLKLSVPIPQFIGKPSKTVPWSFYGHEMIVGLTGCQVFLTTPEYKQAALDLALNLRKLHEFDYASLPHEEDDFKPLFDRLCFPKMKELISVRLEDLKKNFDLEKYERSISRIIQEASLYKSKICKPSLIHGDLYHRHLIFNDEKILIGLIDWGDTSISEPVIDFGVLYQFFPPNFYEDFWNSYGEVSASTKSYAKFLGLCSAITLLWYGHGRKDEALVKTSFKTMEYLNSGF